ncbi:MAG: TIGR02530 family flagellar biosynthesis protein [Lachnospiraceae bacterium]|nr:TIGR02530 family flagellar biosynthesis protein [Lachnospiraceae bacterium]
MAIIKPGFPSIEQVTDQYLQKSSKPQETKTTDGKSFADIYKSVQRVEIPTSGVKFSKHAANRLTDRNIELSEGQLDRLNSGTRQASQKGINESLVLVDDMAFIVNIKNNTVITAMDKNSSDENVFTNIDGAVIA